MSNPAFISSSTPPNAWADQAGVWASTLCVVHCLFTPLILSFSTVLAHYVPGEEIVHRSLALVIALLGAVALARGFRRHRRAQVLAWMGTGLALIFAAAWGGDLLPHHWMEVGVTFAGSVCMICAHRLNHTFCKECPCATLKATT